MTFFRKKTVRRRRYKTTLRSVFSRVVMVLVGVVLIYLFVPLFSKKHELIEKKMFLDKETQEIKSTNEKIRAEILRLETDSFLIEKIAREELGLTKPGEIVYKVISE